MNLSAQEYLAKLLAKENLSVQHGNYSTASFDVVNRVLRLPLWKDKGKDVYDLLVGHEVGHALYTPADGWHDSEKKIGKIPRAYLNIVEDIRIERMIQETYPGIVRRFKNGYKKLFDDDLFGTNERDINKAGLMDRLNVSSKGRGYVPAEENLPKDAPIGVIPVDAIYTPIKRVSYKVENTRVGQRTDYEKLMLDVQTDGTIHPEEAVKEASRILIQHLMLITDENITFDDASSREDNIVDEHILHMRKLLKTSLEDLDLSVRAYNCLKAAKINSLGEMVRYDTHELLKFRNFGKKSLVEIEELLQIKGLTFGMDLSKYKLDEE